MAQYHQAQSPPCRCRRLEGQNKQTLRVGSLSKYYLQSLLPHLNPSVSAPPIQTEVLIIGAGPVGLFQVFQLGLHEIDAHVVDAQSQIGGQCSALYPDKYIYDIPALPRITGLELVEQLREQIAPFKTPIHLGQYIQKLQALDQGFQVTTHTGMQFIVRSVIIAAGVGAFMHKELPLPELKPFRNRSGGPSLKTKPQVLSTLTKDVAIWDKEVIIYGGNDHAVRMALEAATKRDQNTEQSGSVSLVYRREKLEIDEQLQKSLEEALGAGLLTFKVAQITAVQVQNNVLNGLTLTDSQGNQLIYKCDLLIESLGLSPKLGALLDWELEMERKTLKVSPETFCTSIPGIYAVGDINTYPGKRKLILSGFHEATLAAFAVAQQIKGTGPIPLEYTSASTRIHKILGV